MVKRSLFLMMILVTPLLAQVEETMTVIFRDIRVHVIDKNGKPVTDLKKSDFTVFEAKKVQEISTFEERKSEFEEERTVHLPNHLLFIIESGNMYPGSFKKAVEAMEDFVLHRWPENTLVKLVQIEDAMIHLTPFTRDPDVVLSALRQAKRGGHLYNRLLMMERDILRDIREYGSNERTRDNYKISIQSLVHQKAVLKRKHYLAFQRNMMILTAALKKVPGQKSVFLMTGGSFLESAGTAATIDLAEQLQRNLNAAGITFYTLLAKPTVQLTDRAGFMSGMDSLPSSEMGLSIRDLQSRSHFPPDEIGDPTMNTVLEGRSQIATGPSHVTQSTGGIMRSSASTDLFSRDLEDLYDVSQSYYRLGYTRSADQVKENVKVKVRVKGQKENKWKVLYGEEISHTPGYSAMSEQERTLDFEMNLLYGSVTRNDLDIEWQHAIFPAIDGQFYVALYGDLPNKTFPKGGYEIGFAALDSKATVLGATRAMYDQGKTGVPLLLTDTLKLETLPSSIHYMIREVSTGATSLHREAPKEDISFATPGIGPFFFSAGATPEMVPLYATKTEEEKSNFDPFTLGDLLFKPRVGNLFGDPQSIGYYFYLYEPGSSSGAFKVKIGLEGKGVSLPGNLPSIPGKVHKIIKKSNGLYAFYGNLGAIGLAAGNYELNIQLTNPENDKVYQHKVPLVIVRTEQN